MIKPCGTDVRTSVDYVICYKVPPKGMPSTTVPAPSTAARGAIKYSQSPSSERAEAEAGFVQVVESLTRVGLATEVRSGDPGPARPPRLPLPPAGLARRRAHLRARVGRLPLPP